MPFQPMSFPSVGMFAIVLTVAGSVVSIWAFTGWRRIGFALLFTLLGVGELVSIDKADKVHELEMSNQHNDIESLTRELQESEKRRQVENAILRAKLEDYAGWSQLGPALMKLAQTGAEFQKKQYESEVRSDRDLYNSTMKAATKLHNFSTKYKELEWKRLQELSRPLSAPASPLERQQRMFDQMKISEQLSLTKQSEFQASILSDALYAKSELLKRKLPEPTLRPSEKTEVDLALTGMLAGASPALSLATYLELWAKPLAGK